MTVVRSYKEFRELYFPKTVEDERRAAETPQELGERLANHVLAAIHTGISNGNLR